MTGRRYNDGMGDTTHAWTPFHQLVIVENDTTRQVNFVLPVAFTPSAWTELVHCDGDPDRSDVRLFDLLFAARCAIRSACLANEGRGVVRVDHEGLSSSGDERTQVVCHVRVHLDRTLGYVVLFSLVQENC
jgi:hypothetical protein